jgi:hypothetical protein
MKDDGMSDESATARRIGNDIQSAEIELLAGPIQLRLRARVTPVGLLAFGVMMSGIVASASAVVWAARRRRRSEGARP